MNTAQLAAQAMLAALDIYRLHMGKAKNWTPTPAEWEHLRAWSKRTPEDIKREAAEALSGAE